ncbi:D-inositol-3-phosphate glycosyltransferase [Actinomycetota bacterium]
MPQSHQISRVAMVSVHTSPLEQPGTGDAGGMNVYIVETARELARRGVEVEVFTRATTGSQPPVVEMEPGITVRHILAGPYEGLSKEDLPGQLCAFAAGVMRTAAHLPEHHFSLVHSHYWLSGQVGWLAADRWQVPLVHTMHTMARVKNLHLAEGDSPEPPGREIGEAQVVEAAQRLVANTPDEARQLIELYAADPAKVVVVPPGVNLSVFEPGDTRAARAAVGVDPDVRLLLFVGRIQPLKAPDVLVRALATILEREPDWRGRLVAAVVGGPSGSGLAHPTALQDLADELGVSDSVLFRPPVDRATLAQWYRAADVVVVPSYSESFGLVAVEAQACGTPVVAADVGGLPLAVGDAGILIDGHDPSVWADALAGLVRDDARRAALAQRAVAHAQGFSWSATADRLLEVYAAAMGGPSQPIGESDPLTGVPRTPIA